MTVSRFERFRRNHAIEHAAMHQLGRLPQPLRLVARSDWDGFVMYGHIDTETLAQATHRGLHALHTGQSGLAVHPRCGTNMAVHLLLASAAFGLVSSAAKRRPHAILPVLTLSMIGAVAGLGQPLSRAAQAHLFTSVDLDQARIVDIRRHTRGAMPIHRVYISHE
jgi:hypothetical protein